MNVADFVAPASGQLVRITGWDPRYGERYEHFAFVPAPLPPRVELTHATHRAVTTASVAVARLDEAAKRLPNPALLARPAIRQEAVSTSALEGTYAALDDVLAADILDGEDASASVSEVLNYVRAAESAFEWIKTYPISLSMLAQLQKILVRGTRADGPEAGAIRTTQVFIGASGGRVTDARFIPCPPGDQLKAGIRAWQDWINSDDDIPLVAKVALGHYQFETLHPFTDGNGRLGRLVCVLQLAASKELRVPVLNLSPWLETRRREYQDGLLACSTVGAFDRWIRFFSEAMRMQALRAVERIDALLDWRDQTLDRLRAAGVRGLGTRVAEDMIGYPMLTANTVAKQYGMTYQAANNAVRRLVELGILTERTGRRYSRVFTARDVLRIIEAP